MPTCIFLWKPNASLQPLGMAGATQERTLFPVGCTPWFGGCSKDVMRHLQNGSTQQSDKFVTRHFTVAENGR
jgi:hypothetical protein